MAKSGPDLPSGVNALRWTLAFLDAIHAPKTRGNIGGVLAWAKAENTKAKFNPLATVDRFPGSTGLSGNPAGVQNYAKLEHGIQGAVQHLTQNHYGVVNTLRSGKANAQRIVSEAYREGWALSGRYTGHAPDYAGPIPTGQTLDTRTPAVGDNLPAVPGYAPRGRAARAKAQPVTGIDLPVVPGYTPRGRFAARPAVKPATGSGLPAVPGYGPPRGTPTNPAVRVDHGEPISPNAGKVIALARTYLGTPYEWGAAGPKRFDCSGFAQWLWGKMGVQLPRTTYEQVHAGQSVAKTDLRPGDLIFFDTEAQAGPDHEGIYIGHGQFIHSPHTGDVIKISSLNSPFYESAYVTGRRVG